MKRLATGVAAAVLLLSMAFCGRNEEPGFTIATTTSVDNSGLLRHLANEFLSETGIEARWLSVGSGKALQLAAEGKVDLVISHDPARERDFVESGGASLYRQFARNDFVLIGPAANPAGVAPGDRAEEAFRKIARTASPFASRGDSSGTHAREMEIWRAAGVEPHDGSGYISLGQSMSALIRSARELDAYALSDSATFQQVGGPDQSILLESDPLFANVYSVILLRKGRETESRDRAERFARWLLSPAGRQAISAFRINGRIAFAPNEPDL